MLYEILCYLNVLPYGPDERGLVQSEELGEFEIKDGSLSLPSDLQDGQLFVIEGSAFNDGAYEWPETELEDEKFTGILYLIRKKPGFIDLVEEIEAWQTKYGDTVSGPFSSESFAGYSYTKKGSGSSSGNGSGDSSWHDAFKSRLRPWRKL